MRHSLFFLFFVICFQLKAQKPFVLEGTVSDTSLNGQYMYIYGIDYSKLNAAARDSVRITGGRFRFAGALHTPAMLASIHTQQTEKFFHQLMLEPRTMQLTQIGARTYKVSNSPVSHQHEAWKSATAGFSRDQHFAYMRKDSLIRIKAPEEQIAAVNAEVSALKKAHHAAKVRFIREHPEAYISLFWLRYDLSYNMEKQPDSIAVLLNGLSPALRASQEGKLLAARVAVIRSLAPGNDAPAFAVKDNNGKLLNLKDFKGKYVLLDFWASWCGPCLENMPEMKELYAKYHPKGLEILGISLDDKKAPWLAAIKRFALPWPQVSELKGWDGDISRQYNISFVPQLVLIDKAGKIVDVDIDPEKYLPTLFAE